MEVPEVTHPTSGSGCDCYSHGGLDYHGTTPVDQSFRCCDLNLCCLKTLMMIIILDEDHRHYSDAFGNIFKEDTLCKKIPGWS